MRSCVAVPGTRPFTADDYAARMTRAASSAQEAGFAGVLVTPGPDLLYLAGHSPPAVTERLTMLVVSARREPLLIVPTLERPDAERAPSSERLTIVNWPDGADPYETAAAALDASGRYAISDSAWALHLLDLQNALPGSRYVSLSRGLPLLRAVKDAVELERMAAAGAAADAAFDELVKLRFEGRRETDIAADLAELLLAHGHDEIAFTIVGSGPNGANPHHQASERVIQAGDTVVLDFGGLVDGYASDTTRTVHVGEPSAEESEVHAIVREAQQAGYDAVRPGVACEEIDRAARRLIADEGYGERFIHRTGHGIGVTVHEPPYLVEGETLELQPGMCFSIEPGIYLPGRFGVRIEDIVCVTNDGARRLNDTARDLLVVA
jgi:Xaa-Pro aminopeptidase